VVVAAAAACANPLRWAVIHKAGITAADRANEKWPARGPAISQLNALKRNVKQRYATLQNHQCQPKR